jgi:hypothetical protein
MGVSTAAGTALSIGTTALVGSTDTYNALGQITTIPEFGRVYTEIKFSPLSTRGVLKFKGSFDDGSIAVVMGKDSTDAGQQAALVARDVDADYNFKIVANDAVPAVTSTVGISVAAPGLVTLTAHGLKVGTQVQFQNGAGTLPTGLTASTTYFVTGGATLLTNTFAVSTTLALAIAGTGITTTGSAGVGNTMVTVPTASQILMKAKVLSYTTKFDTLDSVVMSTMSLSITSGSIVETPHLP